MASSVTAFCSSSWLGRNSCSGVDQADGHRQAVHRREQALEVGALKGQQCLQGLVPCRIVARQDHALHLRQAVGLEEHMLGAHQADALGTIGTGPFGVARVVGVGPHPQAADAVGPLQQLEQVRVLEVRDHGLELTGVDLTGGAVQRHEVAFAEDAAADPELAPVGVDLHRQHAHHGGLAELSRHQRGVAGAATAAGQDATRREHAVHVVGLGLGPHHDHCLLLLQAPALGGVGVEGQHAAGRARRDVQPAGDGVTPRLGGGAAGGVELRVKEVVDMLGPDPLHRFLAADQLLSRQLDRDAHRGHGAALGVSRLQHPQLAALDGELDVLGLAVVLLQLLADLFELLVQLGHRVAHGHDRQRDARAGDHVLTLGIDQEVTFHL
ncbi:MAG TPA: hypothetical protein PLF63_13855, partial [Rubrivivax sp.]|nr:hypothetical protein [Rubrivivax sp.]